MAPRYSEAQAREAIAASMNWSEALRKLGMCHTGSARDILKKYVELWGISTEHFDPNSGRRVRERRSLDQILVVGSTYSRGNLKQRLYDAGVKTRTCEMCGQGEEWRGRRMSLILDHVNGVRDDHRLENLRIVCPNCAATLGTHCGRNAALSESLACERCNTEFHPRCEAQRYCSITCAKRDHGDARRGVPNLESRRVTRPPYELLLAEIARDGWSAVGRRYGVSDNAVRKWVRQYEREREAAGADVLPFPKRGGGEAPGAVSA